MEKVLKYFLENGKSSCASGVHSELQARVINTANRYLNNIIRLTVTKIEIFENVVTIDEYFFLVVYFIDEIMRITHTKIQSNILHIVRSRTL